MGTASAIGKRRNMRAWLSTSTCFSRVRIWPRLRSTRWQAATKIVEERQGKVVKTETWGLRSLAYRIAKNRKAHYVMLEIDAPGDVVAELERQTQINEDVIRYMTIRVDAHEQGPSAMMRRQERDRSRREERGRRDRDDYEMAREG